MSFPATACFAPKSSILFRPTASTSDLRRGSPFILPLNRCRKVRLLVCLAASNDAVSGPGSNDIPKTRSRTRRRKQEVSRSENSENESFPGTIPRKRKRGRRSEADAVEDFVRNNLERTFSAIREHNPEIFENKEKAKLMKDREPRNDVAGDRHDEHGEEEEMVVEEEDPNWPLDTDVGWGIRASEYFENHPIKNVVGEDGTEIDWEGEIEDNWVREINSLEWESFAFHPSPLVVLVFERYNRASDNWRTLKELEKAIKVYWNAKDRLPPRAVKIDMNMEKDLAYALKAKECPQILFLLGSRILHREKDVRTADELVHMIAHFYYNAKRPSWC